MLPCALCGWMPSITFTVASVENGSFLYSDGACRCCVHYVFVDSVSVYLTLLHDLRRS